MISPYAKKEYVTHVQYETSSVLRFMEDTFGLPLLAASDGRANDPASDAFDFSKPPRKFKNIKSGLYAISGWSMSATAGSARSPEASSATIKRRPLTHAGLSREPFYLGFDRRGDLARDARRRGAVAAFDHHADERLGSRGPD